MLVQLSVVSVVSVFSVEISNQSNSIICARFKNIGYPTFNLFPTSFQHLLPYFFNTFPCHVPLIHFDTFLSCRYTIIPFFTPNLFIATRLFPLGISPWLEHQWLAEEWEHTMKCVQKEYLSPPSLLRLVLVLDTILFSPFLPVYHCLNQLARILGE